MKLLKQFVMQEADDDIGRDPNQPNYASANNQLYGEQDRLDLDNDSDFSGEEDGNQSLDDLDDASRIGDDQDEDRQGLIRTVPGAHLVYKRQQEDGTYEELWIYNIDPAGRGLKKAHTVRNAILAGTDIPVNKTESPDGTQSFDVWAIGNAEMLKICGLIN